MIGNPAIIAGADDEAVAQFIALRLRNALDRGSGPFASITIPGGTTPFPILERLVQQDLPWRRLEVWPGDDRIVSEGHPASNIGRMRAVLEPAGVKVAALQESSAPPHFALAWLGMGVDGHIASLFPNTDPRVDDPLMVRRITPAPLPPDAPFERLSMTIPTLLASDEIMFVIRGSEKAALFEKAVLGMNDLPIARLLAAAHQPVTCFT